MKRLILSAMLLCAMPQVACATPKTVHSVVEFQNHRCEMTHTTLDSRNLQDSNFSYKCDPPLPPGMILTASGMIMTNSVVNLQMATLANAPYNPADQICDVQEMTVDGQVTAVYPANCRPSATARSMTVQPR